MSPQHKRMYPSFELELPVAKKQKLDWEADLDAIKIFNNFEPCENPIDQDDCFEPITNCLEECHDLLLESLASDIVVGSKEKPMKKDQNNFIGHIQCFSREQNHSPFETPETLQVMSTNSFAFIQKLGKQRLIKISNIDNNCKQISVTLQGGTKETNFTLKRSAFARSLATNLNFEGEDLTSNLEFFLAPQKQHNSENSSTLEIKFIFKSHEIVIYLVDLKAAGHKYETGKKIRLLHRKASVCILNVFEKSLTTSSLDHPVL